AAECVQVVGDEFPKLDLTSRGRAVMQRQQTIQLALPSEASATAAPEPPPSRRLPPAAAVAAALTAIPSLTPEVVVPTARPSRTARPQVAPAPAAVQQQQDEVLLERLRVQRTALARAETLPPYCVFNDRTLREMALRLPVNRAELLEIHGIGNAKADKYGTIFLDLIRDYTAARGA
ncbi:MAG: HRDC domain-containing protein, partial [Candidatus Tectomicrobia bacterium]